MNDRLGKMWLGVLLCCLCSAAQSQSLYNEASFRPLTGDNKAFRQGDIITVQVFENSSATTSSDTGTRRKK